MISTLISCILALFILLNRGVSLEQQERELTYEESCIYKYFHLSKRISQVNRRHVSAIEEFQQRSFTPWIEYGELGIKNVGTRVEKVVVDHVFHLQMIELKRDIINFKLNHFQRYLAGLDDSTHQYLFGKYYIKRNLVFDVNFSKTDQAVYEEIREIEEAAAFKFNYEFEKDTSELTALDIEDDFNKMLELMGGI